MNVIGYTAGGMIEAVIEGTRTMVPDDPANRHRQAIAAWEAAGNVVPAYAPPPAFATAAEAKAAMVAWINAFAIRLTGIVPDDERLAWPVKEVAARAILAGVEDPLQAAMIAGEAQITGEAVAELSAKIVAKADLYRAVVANISGLRRATEAAIDAAKDPDAYEAVLGTAQADAQSLAMELGIGHHPSQMMS